MFAFLIVSMVINQPTLMTDNEITVCFIALQSLIPALGGAAAGGGFDIGAALGNLAGGGVTGAIVTVVVNLIKNAVFKKA